VKSIIFLFAFYSSFSFACSCGGGNLEQRVNNYDYVYIGKVISSKLIGKNDVINELEVIQELKSYPDLKALSSSVHYTSCDLPVTVGYKYVVFGNYGKAPSISLCSSSQPVPYDDAELSNLIATVKNIANK
jgi:hypothetical protein